MAHQVPWGLGASQGVSPAGGDLKGCCANLFSLYRSRPEPRDLERCVVRARCWFGAGFRENRTPFSSALSSAHRFPRSLSLSLALALSADREPRLTRPGVSHVQTVYRLLFPCVFNALHKGLFFNAEIMVIVVAFLCALVQLTLIETFEKLTSFYYQCKTQQLQQTEHSAVRLG